MTYYGLFGTGEVPEPCGTYSYGEFEDYCVQLSETNAVQEVGVASIQCYPNPARDAVQWRGKGVQSILCFDATGKCMGNWNVNGEQSGSIDVSQWNNGLYWLQWQTTSGVNQSKIVVSGE
jgi:hypothetical protein